MASLEEFLIGSELNGYRGFFEQDDATGYLYLADSEKVLFGLHIYNRKASINVREEDVQVIWTESGQRCGVLIRGKLCGVIGINGDQCRPAYVLESSGITDPKWTTGFNLC